MSSFTHALKRSIRRPRLLTSALLATILFALLSTTFPPARALLIAFDIGAAVFLMLMMVLMFRASVSTMHNRALIQDEGKWTVLIFSLCVAAIVLFALSHELHAAKDKSPADIVLASSTIFLSWLFVAVIFAQQYAHSFYLTPHQLVFPGTECPDYLDFTYFSLVLSMCCQTSDVAVTSSPLRRLVMLHSVVAFFFNVIIIAITVNVVAGVL
ncbi:MAG TPA: DUF1345 domain-containing protein [Usitatibacteraceae bacterium]